MIDLELQRDALRRVQESRWEHDLLYGVKEYPLLLWVVKLGKLQGDLCRGVVEQNENNDVVLEQFTQIAATATAAVESILRANRRQTCNKKGDLI